MKCRYLRSLIPFHRCKLYVFQLQEVQPATGKRSLATVKNIKSGGKVKLQQGCLSIFLLWGYNGGLRHFFRKKAAGFLVLKRLYVT